MSQEVFALSRFALLLAWMDSRKGGGKSCGSSKLDQAKSTWLECPATLEPLELEQKTASDLRTRTEGTVTRRLDCTMIIRRHATPLPMLSFTVHPDGDAADAAPSYITGATSVLFYPTHHTHIHAFTLT